MDSAPTQGDRDRETWRAGYGVALDVKVYGVSGFAAGATQSRRRFFVIRRTVDAWNEACFFRVLEPLVDDVGANACIVGAVFKGRRAFGGLRLVNFMAEVARRG